MLDDLSLEQTNYGTGSSMSRQVYGTVKSGPSAGDKTLCRAKDKDHCRYHVVGSHVHMTREQVEEWNEKAAASRSGSAANSLSKAERSGGGHRVQRFMSRRAPGADRRRALKKAAATILAVTALSSLAACGQGPEDLTYTVSPNASNSQQAAPRKNTYDKIADKAKRAVGDAGDKAAEYMKSDDYAALKKKAKQAAGAAKDYVAGGAAAADLDSLLDSLRAYGLGGSTGSVNSDSGSDPYSDVSRDAALNELASLKIEPGDESAYDRGQWRHWVATVEAPGGAAAGRRPCFDVRQQVLATQGQNVSLSPDGCRVESASFTDPYTGETGLSTKQVQIDHSVPLGYAAAHGGQGWSTQKKQDYANDLSKGHLVASLGSANMAKSDKGPSEWLPDKDQCGYAKNFADVLYRWDLSTTQADHDVMQNVIQQCAA